MSVSISRIFSFELSRVGCTVGRMLQLCHFVGRSAPAHSRLIQMLDHRTARSICRPFNHVVQIGTDVPEASDMCIDQVNLDLAKLSDATARAVLVTKSHGNALHPVTVAGQREPQAAIGVIDQRGRGWNPHTLNTDSHAYLYG
ncbi:MAG: hypothetical protein V4794_11050 [Pseudomonadota bacterium]